MPERIFLTIIKWWCSCLDLSFEIMARPWEPEELSYRRMIAMAFDQPRNLTKSYNSFVKWRGGNIPSNWKDIRASLNEFTRNFWSSTEARRQMTPKWPPDAIEYLEEFLAEASQEFKEVTNERVIQAFRMMNEVGEKFVPKPLVAEKLGVDDKRWLYARVANFAWHLRARKDGVLKSFAFVEYAPTPDTIVREWREAKRSAAFEARLREWGGKVPRGILERNLDELDFSVRTYNCFKNANLQTVGDLLYRTESELLRMKNFGRKSLKEIKEVLRSIDPVLDVGVLVRRGHHEV